MAYTKEILTLAVEVGECMLRNGAEIYRVEDTVIHILESYDVEEYDVYVLSNGLFASANENREDACSMIRHVPLGAVNLGKISALNQLARDICNHDVSLIDSWDRLEECKNLKSYPLWQQILMSGLGSGLFAFLFGGTALDGIAAFVIGFLEHFILTFCNRHKVSKFITNIVTSLFVTLLAMLITFSAVGLHQDKIIIGSLMPLVPGIAFTTSIRDFYNGDYLSGAIHLIDAMLTAVCIAVGACTPFVISTYLGGV